MRLALVTLSFTVALQLYANGAAADEDVARRTRDDGERGVPTTLRAVHLRDLASREEPAFEPGGFERWFDRVDTTKGGFRYSDTMVVGDRKVKWGIKGPFLRSQEPGITFEVKF
jgi:hypothetical protein